MLNRYWTLAILAAATLAVGACEEKLNGGNACPSLCPEQQLGFKDTVFLASDVIDTMVTLPGIPSIGTETQIMLARYAQDGDSVVTAGVFRFDSVFRSFIPSDTLAPLIPFTSVDSAMLTIQVLTGASGAVDTTLIQDTVTFIAYDVWANVPYLDTGVVHSKFSGVPVGTVTVPRDSVIGSIAIPLDTAWLTHQVVTGTPINIGVIVQSKKKVKLGVTSAEGAVAAGAAGVLTYIGHVDTLRQGISVTLNARADNFGPPIRAMQDYQIAFAGTAPYPPGTIAVGGIPSNRVLVRFKFPLTLIDSTTTVVRAELILTQIPFAQFRVDSDSVSMNASPVLASPLVTDLSKVGVLIDPLIVALKTDSLPPFGSGVDTIQLVRTTPAITAGALYSMFTFWKIEGTKVQRAIVLSLAGEGTEPRELWFYGVNAPLAQQPRVHLSYVPHAVIGLP